MTRKRSRAATSRSRPTNEAVIQRLLDAALAVFVRDGFARASLDSIAAEAGLTKGAIFSNFRGKDDLFLRLLSLRFEQRMDAIRAWREQIGQSDVSTVEGTVEAYVAMLAADPQWQFLFLEFWSRAVRDPQMGQRYRAQRAQLRVFLADFLEQEATRLGVKSRLSPDEAATLLLALTNGLFIEQAADPEVVASDLFGKVLAAVFLPSPGDETN